MNIPTISSVKVKHTHYQGTRPRDYHKRREEHPQRSPRLATMSDSTTRLSLTRHSALDEALGSGMEGDSERLPSMGLRVSETPCEVGSGLVAGSIPGSLKSVGPSSVRKGAMDEGIQAIAAVTSVDDALSILTVKRGRGRPSKEQLAIRAQALKQVRMSQAEGRLSQMGGARIVLGAKPASGAASTTPFDPRQPYTPPVSPILSLGLPLPLPRDSQNHSPILIPNQQTEHTQKATIRIPRASMLAISQKSANTNHSAPPKIKPKTTAQIHPSSADSRLPANDMSIEERNAFPDLRRQIKRFCDLRNRILRLWLSSASKWLPKQVAKWVTSKEDSWPLVARIWDFLHRRRCVYYFSIYPFPFPISSQPTIVIVNSCTWNSLPEVYLNFFCVRF